MNYTFCAEKKKQLTSSSLAIFEITVFFFWFWRVLPHPIYTLSFGGRIVGETTCFVTVNYIFPKKVNLVPLKEDPGIKKRVLVSVL